MTKEKIIETMQKHWHQDGYYTASFDGDGCADELLALVEQAKREQAREIFAKVFNNTECEDLGENCGPGWIHSVYEAQEIAKEYGVELMKTLNMARGNGHTNDFYNDTLVELYMKIKNEEKGDL